MEINPKDAAMDKLRIRLDKAQGARDAMLLYFDGIIAGGGWAEVIGMLVTESAVLEAEMGRLVELQDKEG